MPDASRPKAHAGGPARTPPQRLGTLLFSLLPDLYLTILTFAPGLLLWVTLRTSGTMQGPGPAGLPGSMLAGTALVALMLLWLVALRPRNRSAAGLVLTARAAPPLHTLIESVRVRARAYAIDDVQLGTGLGVSLVRAPRSFLPGFRRHLVIGLPLVFALSRAQFRALLAHELTHVSRARGIRGLHVWRVRDRWLRWADDLAARPRSGDFLLCPFFRWYAPRLTAQTAALAREHEFAADRHAASATRREDLAAALVRLAVIQRLLAERFYPRLLADVRRCGVTPSGLQSRFEVALREMPSDPRFAAWLDAALQDATTPDAAHPSLRERLKRLGIAELRTNAGVAFLRRAFADQSDESIARHCLAEAPPELMLSIEKAWIDDIQREWNERHEELLRLDSRRRELDGKSRLTFSEALEHVITTSETEGIDAALQHARDLTGARPDMAPARFVLGTLLLRNNDPEGLEHLRQAMTLDPGLESTAAELAREFLRANGREHETADFTQREPLRSLGA
jgi:Zn-dependent protease with chaperone function